MIKDNDLEAILARQQQLRDAAREAHLIGDTKRGIQLNAKADQLGGEAFWYALNKLHEKKQ